MQLRELIRRNKLVLKRELEHENDVESALQGRLFSKKRKKKEVNEKKLIQEELTRRLGGKVERFFRKEEESFTKKDLRQLTTDELFRSLPNNNEYRAIQYLKANESNLKSSELHSMYKFDNNIFHAINYLEKNNQILNRGQYYESVTNRKRGSEITREEAEEGLSPLELSFLHRERDQLKFKYINKKEEAFLDN
ncbi:hypothetical protein ABMA71_15275, partial [Halobacteriovorax sp. ZH3_bin.1]